MLINIEGQCHVGRVREENQDAIAWSDNIGSPLRYMILADGMGGYSGGSIASQLAIDTIENAISHISDALQVREEPSLEFLKKQSEQLLLAANQAVWNAKQGNQELQNMGTTLVLALFFENYVIIGHVGDSRAYLYRDNHFTQLTDDHSVSQELMDSGKFSPDDLKDMTIQDALTRAIGTEERVSVDLQTMTLNDQDIILLCSDGLNKHLSNLEIGTELSYNLPIDQSCSRLIEETLSRGAKDNVSIMIGHIRS